MLEKLQPEALDQRIREIDEALLTRAPTALDDALLLVERKSAYEALHPETRHGGDRRSSGYREIKTQTFAFCSDAATRLGRSERAIQLTVQTGEALVEFADQLRPTPIADNAAALRSFVALDSSAKNTVLKLWGDNAKLSLNAALIAARLRKAEDTDDAAFSHLVDAWTRASTKARRRFFTEIGVPAAAAEAVIVAARKRGAK